MWRLSSAFRHQPTAAVYSGPWTDQTMNGLPHGKIVQPIVERSFGWLVHSGGLLRDRAGRLDVSAGRLAFVAILSGFQALLNPMPSRAA
jgi:hypothetical protein